MCVCLLRVCARVRACAHGRRGARYSPRAAPTGCIAPPNKQIIEALSDALRFCNTLSSTCNRRTCRRNDSSCLHRVGSGQWRPARGGSALVITEKLQPELLNASHGISITHSDSHSFLKSLLISVALMHPPTLSRFLPPSVLASFPQLAHAEIPWEARAAGKTEGPRCEMELQFSFYFVSRPLKPRQRRPRRA